jgi:hypothetical protein
MRPAFLDGSKRLVAVAGEPAPVPLVLEDPGDQFADIALVIDNQDVRNHLSLPD